VAGGSVRVMPSRGSARRHRWRSADTPPGCLAPERPGEATPRPAQSACSVSAASSPSAAAGGWHRGGRAGNGHPSDVAIGARSRPAFRWLPRSVVGSGTSLNDRCAARFSAPRLTNVSIQEHAQPSPTCAGCKDGERAASRRLRSDQTMQPGPRGQSCQRHRLQLDSGRGGRSSRSRGRVCSRSAACDSPAEVLLQDLVDLIERQGLADPP
jgi:hypothetical protein